MRFFELICALFAAIALAQSSQNYINVPASGFDVKAGQPFTITWSNPSSGQVTISLTQGNVVAPNAGIQLITVDASAGTATFTIPSDVNTSSYNFRIVDDSNSNNVNFSSQFTISGATAIASASSASMTSSAASSSASASSSSASASSSSSSASASSSSASSSSSSASASRTSSSASASATTSAPSANDAGKMHAGAFFAVVAGAIAVM